MFKCVIFKCEILLKIAIVVLRFVQLRYFGSSTRFLKNTLKIFGTYFFLSTFTVQYPVKVKSRKSLSKRLLRNFLSYWTP